MHTIAEIAQREAARLKHEHVNLRRRRDALRHKLKFSCPYSYDWELANSALEQTEREIRTMGLRRARML